MLQQLWRMRCKKCFRPISLPRRNPEETPEDQRDQPTGTWSLTIVHRHCGQRFDYTAQDVQLDRVEVPDQGKPIDALWHGLFQCAHEHYGQNCGRLIDVHASAEYFLEPHEMTAVFLNTKPPLTCSEAHQLSQQARILDLAPVKRLAEW